MPKIRAARRISNIEKRNLNQARTSGRKVSRRTWLLIGAQLCGGLLTTTVEAAVPVPDLQQYLGQSRVLLVFAPRNDDAALVRQRAILKDAAAVAGERDLVIVEVVGTGAQSAELRHRFSASNDHFRAVLIGKDGGAKLTSAEPLSAGQLAEVIDAMPMRRNEAAIPKSDRTRSTEQ